MPISDLKVKNDAADYAARPKNSNATHEKAQADKFVSLLKKEPVTVDTYVKAEQNCLRWQTIWDHPQNADLKAKRQHPGMLKQDDMLHIAHLQAKEEQGETFQHSCFQITQKPMQPKPDNPDAVMGDGQNENIVQRTKRRLKNYIDERGVENYAKGHKVAAFIDAIGSTMLDDVPETPGAAAVAIGTDIAFGKVFKILGKGAKLLWENLDKLSEPLRAKVHIILKKAESGQELSRADEKVLTEAVKEIEQKSVKNEYNIGNNNVGPKTTAIAKLDLEGHAPIRHGGPNRVTDLQLEDRAVRGIDPASGTTLDAFNKYPDGSPKPHKVGRNATAFTSDEALLQADDFARNSTQFNQNVAAARKNGDLFVDPVELPLKDVFGENYKDAVRGVTRLGSKKNPTGHVPTDFTDGTIKAIYRLDQNGNINLHTLYPNPKP